MGLTLAGATALSAGIGALGNLFGSGATASYNAKEAQKNRDFQERMYNQQVQDNINFWKMQADYNNPSAALQRIQDAGLNPLLYYSDGQGMSGNLTSAPASASAPHGAQASAHFNTAVDFANLAMLKAQTRLAESQANKNENESELIKSKTEATDYDTMFRRMTQDMNVKLLHGQFDLNSAMIRDYNSMIWNRGNLTTQQVLSMIQTRQYEIKRFDLDKDYQGNMIQQGWKQLEINRESVSAQLSQAAAAMIHARAAARVSDAQVALFSQEYAFNVQNNPLRLGETAFQVLAKRAGWQTEQANTFAREFKNRMLVTFGSEETGQVYKNVAPFVKQAGIAAKNLMDPRWWLSPLGDYSNKSERK